MGVVGAEEPAWRAGTEEWFAAHADDPSCCLVVVERDGEVVAGAMGAIIEATPGPSAPDGRRVHVSNVCTLPAHRGRGHARRVVEAVIDWARAEGIARVELHASADGEHLYESLGFVPAQAPSMRLSL